MVPIFGGTYVHLICGIYSDLIWSGMKIGFIGLGKMGFNMVLRLLNDHHAVISLEQDESFAMKMLAALRNQFGGHAVKTKNTE